MLIRDANYDDLVKAPENEIAELIDGDLYTWPRPSGAHGDASSVLGMCIGYLYRLGRGGPGGWWIVDEPELHLGKNVLVPDLAGWRRERMRRIPDDHRFIVPPDWICEVLSPSTARIDRQKKMRIYAEHGVAWAWLVDLDYQTLEVMQLDDGKWRILQVYSEESVVHAEPFPEATIELASMWPARE
jgi:Uma2 family endonuclease